MIKFFLSLLLLIVLMVLIMAPIFAFVLRKELKEIYQAYKDEQKRVP